MTKLSWGIARKQVLVLRPQISEMLDRGMKIARIYEDLSNKGSFTGGKRAFEKNVKKLKAEIEANEKVIDQRPVKKFIENPKTETETPGSKFEHDADSSDFKDMWK